MFEECLENLNWFYQMPTQLDLTFSKIIFQDHLNKLNFFRFLFVFLDLFLLSFSLPFLKKNYNHCIPRIGYAHLMSFPYLLSEVRIQ